MPDIDLKPARKEQNKNGIMNRIGIGDNTFPGIEVKKEFRRVGAINELRGTERRLQRWERT